MSDPGGQGRAAPLPAISEGATTANAPSRELQEVAWTARALVSAATVPDGIRGKPGDILAVMLAGRELGIGPMASLRMVHIINGQTSIATELKLGLAERTGHHVVILGEGEGWCVVGCDDHPEAGCAGWKLEHSTVAPEYPGLQRWRVAEDITYETWGAKQGERVRKRLIDKDNWASYAPDMLWNRAASQFMRRHCPGLAGGMYTTEELNEGGSNAVE